MRGFRECCKNTQDTAAKPEDRFRLGGACALLSVPNRFGALIVPSVTPRILALSPRSARMDARELAASLRRPTRFRLGSQVPQLGVGTFHTLLLFPLIGDSSPRG